MDGYKQTEVEVIPKDWEVSRLKELLTIKSGFAFSNSYFSDTGPILLTPGNFKLEGGLYFNERNIKRYSGPYSSMMQFDYGDLLLVMTDLTPDCNLLGKPAFVHLRERILHNQRIGKVIVNSNRVSPGFLYRFFLSDTHSRRMKETATGSTVRHTSNASIYNSLISLPPRSEQEAIVVALSDVDALIESLEKLIIKKRNIKQGAMQELLYPRKKWIVGCIGNLLKIMHGKSQQMVAEPNGTYPILATGGQIGTTNRYLYDKPSVLIGRKGTIDRPQYMDQPFWSVDTLFYSVIYEPNNPKYLFYQFCLIDWKQYNEASGVPSLNARTVEGIEIMVPPPDEQTAIASVLSDMDAEITALEAKLDKTRQLKQGMMHDLLTGRIRLV